MGSSITLDGGLTQGQLREELGTFKSQIEQSFDKLEERLIKRIESEALGLSSAFNLRFDQIDKRLDGIEQRLGKVERRLDAIESFQAAQQKLA